MAQTKRKRRTKHRGTAAGNIEARGKTSKAAPSDRKRNARSGSRGALKAERVPTWKSAWIRAGFASLLLFLFMSLGVGGDVTIWTALGICLVAMAIYVPLGYWTDQFVYRRRVKRTAERQKGG